MMTLQWEGPYLPDQLFVTGVGLMSLYPGQRVTVSDQVGGGMMLADESWWVIASGTPGEIKLGDGSGMIG